MSEQAVMSSPKEQILSAYAREHATTMRVLRAYPNDKLDLRPHAMCKTARELAWVFAVERGLGSFAFNNGLASGAPPGGMPEAPAPGVNPLPLMHRLKPNCSGSLPVVWKT